MTSGSNHTNIDTSTVGFIATNSHVNVRDIYVTNSKPQNNNEYGEFNSPAPNKNFKGRESDIEKLNLLFFNENKRNLVYKIVLCGLPGIGKSELAKQYAEMCKINKYVDRVFWISAESLDPNKSSVTLKNIYEEFETQRCLYIFDNDISRTSITLNEPPDNDKHFLLITSQTKNWGNEIVSVELDPLSQEAAIEVLKSILDKYYNEKHLRFYKELAGFVSYIPLGLQIIGGYVRKQFRALQQNFKLEDYILTLKKAEEKFIEGKIPSSLPNIYKSIYSAVEVSINNIKSDEIQSINKIKSDEDTEIQDIAFKTLLLCSYLQSEFILLTDLNKLHEIGDSRISEMSSVPEDKLKLALNLLKNNSFLNYQGLQFVNLQMHTLVQTVVRFHFTTFKRRIQTNFYNTCLEYIFNHNKNYELIRDDNPLINSNSKCFENILKQVDENKTLVYNFFRNKIYKHTSKNKKVLSRVKNIFCKKTNNESDGNCELTIFLGSLVMCGCIECLQDILKDFYKKDYFNDFELLKCAVVHHQMDILILLLKYVNVNTRDEDETTALHIACRFHNLKAIKILFQNNADMTPKNKFGNIPEMNRT